MSSTSGHPRLKPNQNTKGMKMKTQIKTLCVAIAVTGLLGVSAMAQQIPAQTQQRAMIQGGQTQALVQPGVQPIQQNPFYFGMQIELRRNNWGRTTLRVVGVTPGSPAQMAGLEYGDEIRRVNGRGFRFATDSYHAVRMMNQFVVSPVTGGPAPAVAMVVGPGAPPNPIARMVVRNVRNGQDVIVNVYPTRVGGGAPAVAAATAGG